MYFGRLLPEGDARFGGYHPHDDVECGDCHGLSAKGDSSRSSFAKCGGCHMSPHADSSMFARISRNDDCGRCHSFHHPDLIAVGTDTMSMAFVRGSEALCADCHKQGLHPEVSPGHRGAASLMHAHRSVELLDSPSEFCLSCHDGERSRALGMKTTFEAPRFHTAASHTFGEVLTPGFRKPGSTLKIQNIIPASIVTFEHKIECQTCHSLVTNTDFLLVMEIEDGLCTSCHDMGREQTSAFALSDKHQ